MLNFYHAEKQEVLQVLHSDQTAGLTEEQAREARSRYGENNLKEKIKKTMLQRFLDQFKDVMILILIGRYVINITSS